MNAKILLLLFTAVALAGCATRPVRLGERIGGRSYEHVAFSPDSRFLATSCPWGKESIIIDLVSRTECSRFKPDKKSGTVVGLFYTPDGRLLAAYFGANSVTVWDTSSSNLISRLVLSEAPRMGVFSPDGRWLATIAKNNPPTIWEVATARKTAELTDGPTTDVVLAFSHDGCRFAATGRRQEICIYDTASGQRISQLPPSMGKVRYLAFAPDDTRLAVSANDVSVFCLTNSESPNNLRAPSVSAGGKAAAVILTLAATLGGWPAFPGPEVFVAAPSGPLEFSPSGHHLAIVNSAANLGTALGKDAQQVRVFDFAHSNLISTATYDTRINSVAFSPDGHWIATAGDMVEIWDYTNSRPRPTAYMPVVVCLQTNFPANPSWPPVHALAKQVCVGAFTDARQQEKLGERTATFKVKMSDVLPSRPVAESMRDAVAALFTPSAQPVDQPSAALKVVGTVRKFSVQIPASLVSWEIEAEVELELQINDAAGKVVHSATYRGQAHHTTAVWPTESLIEKTCNDAIRQLLEHIQDDPVWQTL